MLKNQILIVFLLIFMRLSSQSKFNRIEYSYRVDNSFIDNEIISKQKGSDLRGTINFLNSSLKHGQGKLFFYLDFNKTKSKYYMKNILNRDHDKKMKLAIISNRGLQTYFQNLADRKVIYRTKVFGDIFNVESELDSLNWNLTRIEKNIGKYICYKATTNYRKKTIEAWFTPEIPFGFGPKGYGGLPGLILELKENNLIYYVQKINLSPKSNTKISFPKRKDIISRKKFDSIGEELKSKFRKSYN